MCRAVSCKTCGNTTWAGCGKHVDQVMKGVPAARRCTCDRTARTTRNPFARLFGSKSRF